MGKHIIGCGAGVTRSGGYWTGSCKRPKGHAGKHRLQATKADWDAVPAPPIEAPAPAVVPPKPIEQLAEAIKAIDVARIALAEALLREENSGDHDHGDGPIYGGRLCAGGDCLVVKARRILAGLAIGGAS